MANMIVLEEFKQRGGTEMAPMSTSADLKIALGYSKGASVALLFRMRLDANQFLQKGVDIRCLSCFPHEEEYLYPPLTFVNPVSEPIVVETLNTTYRVIDVQPTFPTERSGGQTVE